MIARRVATYVSVAAMVIAACVALTACGSSSSSSSSSTAPSGESGTETGEAGSGGSSGANVEAAAAMIKQYEGKPTPFPVDEPLKEGLAPGEELAYLQCATPVCALLSELYEAAAETMHTKLFVVKASESTESLQDALSTIYSKKPAALIISGVNRASLGEGLKQFQEGGIPISSNAVMGTEAQGIDANTSGEEALELVGEILANWSIVKGAPEGELVWFETPELDFSKWETIGVKKAMEQNCPECKVVYSKIPISQIGSTAPTTVVSELQSHPDANVVMFASYEAATGLPAALKAAGISGIEVSGYAPPPVIFEYVKKGELSSVLGLDLAIQQWTSVDAAVRMATGQPLTKSEKNGLPVIQLLDQESLANEDVSKGWSGYPDFAERFAKLWAAAGQ